MTPSNAGTDFKTIIIIIIVYKLKPVQGVGKIVGLFLSRVTVVMILACDFVAAFARLLACLFFAFIFYITPMDLAAIDNVIGIDARKILPHIN